jgi:uncharacterized paraquat-inducible protein A
MTVINRICPELSDIKAIRLECNQCGAMISYIPKNWKAKFLDCPNCSVSLVRARDNSGNQSPELLALDGLVESIKELIN